MSEWVTFDPVNKLIIVTKTPHNGIAELDIQRDFYSVGKEDWQNTHNGFPFPLYTIGGEPIAGGVTVGAYFFLDTVSGWRIRPYELDYELRLTGNLYSLDPEIPLFTPTIGAYSVSIFLERSSLTQRLTIEGSASTGGITRNEAIDNFSIVMVDSGNHITPKEGLTVSGTISKDGGVFNSLTNSVTEIGQGAYKVNLTATELNADVIILKFEASGADPRVISFLTSS